MEKKTRSKIKYCRYLRAKNSYGLMEGGEDPWLLPDTSNTICWCIKTGEMSAPDSGFVSPEGCKPGRRCYEAPLK